MTMQRKRGVEAEVWKRILHTDNRGNKQYRPRPLTEEPDYKVKVWIFPQRSSRAEVPGQQQIDVIRIGIKPDIEDVGLWSIVRLLDDYWDVVAPPAYHHGTRRTRHLSMDLRRRPNASG